MKKGVFIIHGWEGNPNMHWFPWLKKELQKRDFLVVAPQMPDTMSPKLNSWVQYLHRVVKNPNEDVFLVGHSLGCITILRFIESLKGSSKIGGAVLVAGFGRDLDYEGYKGELSSFFETPIKWENIRKHCNEFIAIHSKDDPYVNLDNSKIFKERLNAQTIIHENRGHYNASDGVKEFPELLKLILGL